MVVSQIAILTLREPPPDGLQVPPGLLEAMKSARSHVQGETGNFFYHLSEVEDPKKIYVLGEWESVEFHMDVFLKREENKEKVKSFVEWVDVRSIKTWHLDLLMKDVSVDAPLLSISRLAIPKARRADFTKTFEGKLRDQYQSFLTKGKLAYGWVHESSEDVDVDEFVMIAPWKDVQQHLATGDALNEFGHYVKGAPQLKHVKRIYF